MRNTIRTRWAAIGAAIAISLGAGGVGITQATTSSGEMPIYIPIEPCRLADLRPAPDTVGPRDTPLGADETYLLSGWGSVGNCTLPSGTTGLSLNVTALGQTLPTFITLFPGDADLPLASHLNPTPGEPPTPNAVNVDLDTSGEFNVYNLQGTVNVFIDVVGYFDDHVHTGDDIVDGSLTGDDIGDNTVSNADTSNEPGVVSSFSPGTFDLTAAPESAIATAIRVPSDGHVVVQVTGRWTGRSGGRDVADCQLQKGDASAIDRDEPWFRLDERNAGNGLTSFSAHRVIPIAVADNPAASFLGQSLRLVCEEALSTDAVRLSDLHISATFFATSYAPVGLVVSP